MEITQNPEQKIARRILNKYKLTPPIDVLSIIQNYATIEEAAIPNKVDAICMLNGQIPKVILNSRISNSSRKRFTLAHELGHISIPWHAGMFSCHTEGKNLFDEAQTEYYQMERQANNFAAEFLMPSPWIIGQIEQYEDYGFKFLIEKIIKDADVSLTAAFLNLFNFLPPGYIGFIKYHGQDYGKKLISGDIDILIPTKNDLIDFDWLSHVSIDNGVFPTDSFVIYWWKIEIVEVSRLKNLLVEMKEFNLNFFFKELLEGNQKIVGSLFPLLPNQLPMGYIVTLTNRNFFRLFRSPDTTVRIKDEYVNSKYVVDREWLKTNTEDYGEYKIFDYTIEWWKFPLVKPDILKLADKRSAKMMLEQILEEAYSDETEKSSARKSLAGIIGALNGSRIDNDFNKFHGKLRMRLIGDQLLRNITKHKLYEDYLIKRVKELLEKQK